MVGSGRQTLGVELGQECVQIAGLKVLEKRKQSASLESQESLFEVGQEENSFGIRTFLWTMEQEIST
jgi:hypothetical protein